MMRAGQGRRTARGSELCPTDHCVVLLSVRPEVQIRNQIQPGVAINPSSGTARPPGVQGCRLFVEILNFFRLIDRLLHFFNISLLQEHRTFAIGTLF